MPSLLSCSLHRFIPAGNDPFWTVCRTPRPLLISAGLIFVSAGLIFILILVLIFTGVGGAILVVCILLWRASLSIRRVSIETLSLKCPELTMPLQALHRLAGFPDRIITARVLTNLHV